MIRDTTASIENPVIQELLQRRAGKTSSAKLALIVEGGAMRGVYSGGALVALDQLGLSSVFDEVYAESAGAINACYFLSGQTQMGIRIYTEDLQTLNFINPLRSRAIINVDYVVDVVLARKKPLDQKAVLASRSDLFVAITNALDGSPRLVDVKREDLPLSTLLKATMAVVPLYNRSVLLNGIPYVDGGISNPIPIQSALSAECTHILVLLTRPPDFNLMPYADFQKLLLSFALRGWKEEFVRRYYTDRLRQYRLARDLAFGRKACPAEIAVITPASDSPQLTRTTISPRKLKSAMEDAMRRTHSAFA